MTNLSDSRQNATDSSARRQRSMTAWIIGGVVACLVVVMSIWGMSGNSDLGTTARPNTGGQQSTTGTAPSTPPSAPGNK